MRIAILSDTHHEFGTQIEQAVLTEPVDVLILAGDIDKAGRSAARALAIGNNLAKHIVFIAGNHEFYGERVDKARRKLNDSVAEYMESYNAQEESRAALTALGLKSEAMPALHFLDNTFVDIDGYRFVGATLWTDFNLYGNQPLAMWDAEQAMNDYRRIKVEKNGVYRKLIAKDVLSENLVSSQFIWDQIITRAYDNLEAKTVVITHHAPDAMSIDDDFQGSNLNPAYANNFGNRLAYEAGPRLWVHGHMHCHKDYVIGNTQVICNPYGYPGQLPDRAIRYMDI